MTYFELFLKLARRLTRETHIKKTCSYIFFLLFSSTIVAATFVPNATYDVCFTPGENCTAKIIDEINHAQHRILIQAYTFTSKPITKALFYAARRGIDVKALLDKSDLPSDNHFSIADYFAARGINTKIDYQPNIAHNKIIIIDDKTVITGSFNFTYAAQNNNAENLLIISDPTLAAKYLVNWNERAKKSISIGQAKKNLTIIPNFRIKGT